MVFTGTIATEKRDILVAMIATAEPLTSVAPHPMEGEDMIDMIDTIHTTGMTITGGLITMPVSGLEEVSKVNWPGSYYKQGCLISAGPV